MGRTRKARVMGNVICIQSGNIIKELDGLYGDVVRRMDDGKVTVMRIDGHTYYLPTEMTVPTSCELEGGGTYE